MANRFRMVWTRSVAIGRQTRSKLTFFTISLLTLAMTDGDVDGVGIDLSGSTAALYIIFDSSSDLNNFGPSFPTSYEGVPVEEDVIHVVDLSTDTSQWGSGSD